jgi:hypothetical protein
VTKLEAGYGIVWIACVFAVACTPTKPPAPPTVVIAGCEHFKPISASRRDTDETKEQILAHNAEYVKVCGK